MLLASLVCWTATSGGQPVPAIDDVGERPVARASKAMVAASNSYSTRAALEILHQGGNAVDAAIAAALVAMVAEPNMVTFGGFGSLIWYNATSRETRFSSFWMQYPEQFNPDADGGPGAYVIAPGAPKGLHQAATKYGKLPFKTLVQPAIKLAREGFPVYGTLYGQLFERYSFLTATGEGREAWTRDGFLPQPGSTFRQSALADTLEHYSERGPDYIHDGPVAQKLVDTVAKYGGHLSRTDLLAYQVLDGEAGRSTYRDYEVRSSWPPDSGGLGLALGLNILEQLDLRKTGPYTDSVDSAYYIYATLETVQNLTRYVRDSNVYHVPDGVLQSKEFAAVQAQRIRYEKQLAEQSGKRQSTTTLPEAVEELYARRSEELSTGTVHISVIDERGNACGITASIAGDTFGQSGIMVDGVLLNGSGHFRPSGRSDTRWSSAAAPSIVFRGGSPYMVFGSPSDIYSTMFQVAVNVLDFGMDPQQAVSAPRMYARRAQFTDTKANYLLETRFNERILKGLKAAGASVAYRGTYANPAGAARVVVRDPKTGQLLGGVDPRRPGSAVGY